MADDSFYVSRHFLDRQAQKVRFIPFAEAGPAEDAGPGTMLAHRLFVTGGWRQELKVGLDVLVLSSQIRDQPLSHASDTTATHCEHC